MNLFFPGLPLLISVSLNIAVAALHQAEYPDHALINAFRVFNLDKLLSDECQRACLEQLSMGFGLDAGALKTEFNTFQRFAPVVFKEAGDKDSFAAWAQSVNQVNHRSDSRARHPCSVLGAALQRLGAFRHALGLSRCVGFCP